MMTLAHPEERLFDRVESIDMLGFIGTFTKSQVLPGLPAVDTLLNNRILFEFTYSFANSRNDSFIFTISATPASLNSIES